MSQVGREDWWTKPLDAFAREVWEAGWNRTYHVEQVTMMSAILQTRASLQAAADTKSLVRATWALVASTLIVALVAVLAG